MGLKVKICYSKDNLHADTHTDADLSSRSINSQNNNVER